MAFDWATTYCPQAQYVFKVDDDRKVNFNMRLVDFCESPRSDTSGVMCMAYVGVTTVRREHYKWSMTYAEYPETMFPKYCAGGPGYAVSLTTARRLLEEAYNTRVFWVEDLYISGIIRQRLGVAVTKV